MRKYYFKRIFCVFNNNIFISQASVGHHQLFEQSILKWNNKNCSWFDINHIILRLLVHFCTKDVSRVMVKCIFYLFFFFILKNASSRFIFARWANDYVNHVVLLVLFYLFFQIIEQVPDFLKRSMNIISNS